MSEPLRRNPFPASAVAVVDLDGEDQLSIATHPLAEAVPHLAAYLRPGPGERDAAGPTTAMPELAVAPPEGRGGTRAGHAGAVLAVIGDYGTGKTHLAVRLIREARRARVPGGMVVHAAYLDATGGGFDELYRKFTEQISQADLLETVRDYYADVVADALERSEVTQGTAQRLRDRELDPASVIEGLGLIDSLLARELRQDLIDVTENQGFGIALTMLLRRPEFAGDVWAWLTGNPPSVALKERGITTVISGEDLALEAMGVFAHLYRRRNHRFVLVIDELHKLLEVPPRPDQLAPPAAFRKLLDVFLAAGAFLVVVGLPDLFDTLGEGIRQRFTYPVNMTQLEGDDVARLIEAAHQREFGRSELAPFDPTAPELIASLAGGSVRQVIRLCHRSYRLAIQERAHRIGEDTIRRAAHSPVEFPTLNTVRRELRRRLNARGLSYQQQYWLSGSTRPVDFWITVGTRPTGCAVILSSSVVTEEDARPLVALARAVRSEFEGGQAVLVVVGYLNRDLRPLLMGALSFEPVEYGRYDFDEELSATLDGALRKIEGASGQDLPARVLERLTWMNQQQVYAQDYLEQLSRRIDEIQVLVGEQTDALHRQRTPPAEPVTEPLPPPVGAVFQDASRLLAQLGVAESAMRTALSLRETSTARAEQEQRLLRWLDVPDLYPAMGVVGLLRDLVGAFRAGVSEWFDDRGSEPGGSVDSEGLTNLCNLYEVIYDHLPLPRLDEYLAGLVAGGRPGDRDWATWSARQQAVPERLGELGKRVLQAASATLTPRPGPAGRRPAG